jgi:hypothetical protein
MIRSFRIPLLIIILCLAGCGGTDYDYAAGPGEMQSGPGLISGEDGVFTIYQANEKEEDNEKDDDPDDLPAGSTGAD